MLAGPESTQEEIDNLRTELGLNEPILIQLLNHFVNLVQGDFGYSTIYQGSPLEAILERIPYTLLLTLCAIAVTIVLGITGGILAALFYNSILDFFSFPDIHFFSRHTEFLDRVATDFIFFHRVGNPAKFRFQWNIIPHYANAGSGSAINSHSRQDDEGRRVG